MKYKNQFGPKGWAPERISSLKGKTYLITGANSGTWFEASKILLSKGAKVIMLNRNPKKSEDAIKAIIHELGDDIDVSFIHLDLAELASVRKTAKEVLENVSSLDALICNGAIAQVPEQKITVDGFESQMGINHYGHFLLQGILFPLIEKSKWRIVTVGSMGYDMGIKTIKFDDINWDDWYTPNNAYSQSKLAQIMSVYELQDRLERAENRNVKVYACHPGASRTSLIKTSGSLLMRFIFFLMTPLTQSAERGCYPLLMCATESDLEQKGFYGPTWRSNWVGPVWEHYIEPHAKDKDVARKLWEMSEKATNFIWKI